MASFLIALVIVVGGWWLVKTLANAQPAQVRGLVRKIAGGAIMVFAGFMALRGGINVAIPLFLLGLGLMGQTMAFPNGFPWNRKSPGQTSRVATSVLAMELDHDTSTMDGEILSGPMKGRRLSSLTPDELRAVHRVCSAAADQSRALLEAWLDRTRTGWREQWGNGEKQSAMRSNGVMTRKEALAILGLKEAAGLDEVRSAHRRLMKEYHPDHGGSDYIAAKINEAKDVLLQELGART